MDATLTPTLIPSQISTTPTASETSISPSATPTAPEVSATPSATVSYVGPDKRPGTSITAEYLFDTPKMDGYLSDWDLTIHPVSHVVYGESNRKDEIDLSASVMVGWDETYLYLGARVKDDVFVQNSSAEFIYLGDSVELLLDTEVSEDFYLNSLSGDDFQLGISPGSPKNNLEPEAYLWFPKTREGSREQVDIGVLRTSNGYHIEIAVPWRVFGVDPKTDQHFGFAFSVSDNDSKNKDVQQSMVSNVSTRSLTRPMTWGDLKLMK
jgi:hypothetical protein